MFNLCASTRISIIFTPEGFVLDPMQMPCDTVAAEIKRLREDPTRALYELARYGNRDNLSQGLLYAVSVAEAFLTDLTQLSQLELVREFAVVKPSAVRIQKLLMNVPFSAGSENVNAEWISRLYEKLLDVFRFDIGHYSGAAETYLAEKTSNLRVQGKLYMHLIESGIIFCPFKLFCTFTGANHAGIVKHMPLEYVRANCKNTPEGEQLERELRTAAQNSRVVSDYLAEGNMPTEMLLSAHEAHAFLQEVAGLEAAGIICRIPDFWRRRESAIGITVDVGKKPAGLNAKTLVELTPWLTLDGDALTDEEIEMLLNESAGLAQLKGKWVAADPVKIRDLLAFCDKYGAEGLPLYRLINRGHKSMQDDLPDIQISQDTWLGDLINNLHHPKSTELLLPKGFKGTLRPYQATGFDWLYQHWSIGTGACLADDMGLGKTPQVLAFLEKIREEEGGKVLLVVPASLLGNWEQEIQKFTPEMDYRIIHGAGRGQGDFLHITTYHTLLRRPELQAIQWDLVILDEAQAIKNPFARMTKVIKSLYSRMRIAITGTPLENNPLELWSLLDFANCGSLGTISEFNGFVQTQENDQQDYSKLREIIQPFLLRRLKVDKSIIADLPKKTTVQVQIYPSKLQAALYQDKTMQLLPYLNDEKMKMPPGLIFSVMSKLKQICNHPDQHLGQSEYAPAESGKFLMLAQICKEIRESGEKVLVFTQYKEITGALDKHLASIFGNKGIVIHGGISAKTRTKLVNDFQSDPNVPYAVISIKAGGTGLNLTAANHVVMFDHWYNPAVENQAIDRAYRIGQKKDVKVYNFITTDTIEEAICELLEAKMELFRKIINRCSETWLSMMANQKVRRVLRMGA